MKKVSFFLAMFVACMFLPLTVIADDDLFGGNDQEDDGVESADGAFNEEMFEKESDEATDEEADGESEKNKDTDGEPAADFKANRIGALLGGGLGLHAGNYLESTKPRFTMGFTLTFDHFLSETFAFSTGLGLVGKGTRYTEMPDNTEQKDKILYMEIPIGFKLMISDVVIGAGFSLDLALVGNTVDKDADKTSKWGDSKWNNYGRANFSGKIFAGYQLEVGPLYLIPGVDWSIQMLNNVKKGNLKSRNMNVLFCVAVQYGL